MTAAVATITVENRALRSAAVRVRDDASLSAHLHLPCLTLLPYPGAGLTECAAGDGGTVF